MRKVYKKEIYFSPTCHEFIIEDMYETDLLATSTKINIKPDVDKWPDPDEVDADGTSEEIDESKLPNFLKN